MIEKKQQSVFEIVLDVLEAHKAQNMIGYELNSDSMLRWSVIASGTSGRHLHALADYLTRALKKHALPYAGVEGAGSGEWIVFDALEGFVHLFIPPVRTFYQLEDVYEARADKIHTVNSTFSNPERSLLDSE